MAARTWSGAVDGDVTVAGNYDTIPSGTDTLTIPAACANYPSAGIYPATGAVTIDAAAEIAGGTFSCAVTNSASGVISGGVFKSTVHNDGAITAGTFEGAVAAHGAGSAITGGYILGALTYTAGTLVTSAASTIIAAAANVRKGTGRWTGATGANVGSLGADTKLGCAGTGDAVGFVGGVDA